MSSKKEKHLRKNAKNLRKKKRILIAHESTALASTIFLNNPKLLNPIKNYMLNCSKAPLIRTCTKKQRSDQQPKIG